MRRNICKIFYTCFRKLNTFRSLSAQPKTDVKVSKSKIAKNISSMNTLTNVLIYSEDKRSATQLEKVFTQVLDSDRYTIYSISREILENGAWRGRTALLAIVGKVHDTALKQYFLEGGKILGLHTNLLKVFILNHGANNQDIIDKFDEFKIEVHQEKVNLDPPIRSLNNDQEANEFNVEVDDTPVTIKVTNSSNNGVALFCQADLETSLEDKPNKYNKTFARILKNYFNLHTKDDATNTIMYTEGYFLGNHEEKLNLMKQFSTNKDGTHELQDLTIQWCLNKETVVRSPSKTFLPIYFKDKPSNFNAEEYYTNLTSKNFGRLLIYSDVLNTTMDIVKDPLAHGIAVVAKRQLLGKGRSGNAWITPPGQAAISLQLWLKMSPILPLTQHAAALAVVVALRKYFKELNVRIKWPNDIYYGRDVKIGGVITTANCMADDVIVNIGTGVNIANKVPTVSVNDIIAELNKSLKTDVSEISIEAFLGRYCSELESLIDILHKDIDEFLSMYYEHWLHDNEEVKVQVEDKVVEGTISGVDSAGWLRVKTEVGEITVAPDGNSFDMMNGLVAPKINS